MSYRGWPRLRVIGEEDTGMTKVDTLENLDFYIGTHVGRGGYRYMIYNIVPKGSTRPTGGYLNMKYIEKIKGVKFPERYQLPGYSGPYPHDLDAGFEKANT